MSYFCVIRIHRVDGTVDSECILGSFPFAKGAVVNIGKTKRKPLHLYVVDTITKALNTERVDVRELGLLDSMKIWAQWLAQGARITLGV